MVGCVGGIVVDMVGFVGGIVVGMVGFVGSGRHLHGVLLLSVPPMMAAVYVAAVAVRDPPLEYLPCSPNCVRVAGFPSFTISSPGICQIRDILGKWHRLVAGRR